MLHHRATHAASPKGEVHRHGRIAQTWQSSKVVQVSRRTSLQPCHAVKKPQGGALLTSGLVTLLTEGLRLAGVGKQQYEEIASQKSSVVKRLRKGDVAGLMSRISKDFRQNAYIVTGIIDESIYDDDCFFADPTVAFSGLALWQRNLQLLVPFLIQPKVQLLAIKKLGRDEEGAQQIRSEWKLEATLSLPWRPFVSVLGATVYTLNSDANQVVKHVESWNVSGSEAVMQILRPGPRGS